jgi:outer membrane protein
MRNLIKITAVVFFVATAAIASAQTPKFGHIDLQALVQVMPERDSAEAAFNKFQTEVEDLYATMQKELNTLYEEFEKLPATTSDLVKSAKAQDIQDKDQRLKTYSANANQQLNAKYSELMTPVLNKAKTAIEAVAKEQGLIYVFDVSNQGGIILYKSNESKDVLPQVKVKLGIK